MRQHPLSQIGVTIKHRLPPNQSFKPTLLRNAA